MKTSLGKFVAVAMAATMALSVSGFAAAVTTSVSDASGTASTVSGLGTVETPFYKISVPTAMNISIDPLRLNAATQDTQIYTTDAFSVLNKSSISIDVNIKAGVKLVTTAPAPASATEDAVYAASQDLFNKNRLFSMYVAPATKLVAAADYQSLDTTTEYAEPTRYIGIAAAAPATFNASLAKSAAYLTNVATYSPPTSTSDAALTMTAFKLAGSCNKNANWVTGDITPTVSYTFAGVDTDTFNATSYVTAYGTGADKGSKITKFAHAAGSPVVTTPRFRTKTFTATVGTEPVELQVEIGSAMAAFIKANADLATPATHVFKVSAITLTKDGVADTKTIDATKMGTISFEVLDEAAATGEGGLLGKLTLPTSIALVAGSTYQITAITITITGGITTGNTFAISGVGSQATIVGVAA